MLVTLNEASNLIKEGKILFVSGDENLLKKLPIGKWIGGTIPYFMDSEGGKFSEEKVFINEMPSFIKELKIKWYDETNLANIAEEAYDNGFSYIIIPATSQSHIYYAQNAPNFKNIFMKPIIGWISGVNLNNLGKITPKVINGENLEISDKKAIVMHLSLPKNKIASIGIVNLFTQGDGDEIKFEEEGFQVKDCLINNKKMNFSEYLISRNIDIKLPLVANYCGAMVNVSFQGIDKEGKKVNLYAPVFKDVIYKIAKPVTNYVKEFTDKIPKNITPPIFSCNCILNYLYSELEGKKTGNITGPMTFGEIAYQLLNQTLVYLEIIDT